MGENGSCVEGLRNSTQSRLVQSQSLQWRNTELFNRF